MRLKIETLKIFKTKNIEIFGQTKENEFFGCIFKVTYFIKIMPTKRKRVSGLGSIKRRAKQRLKIVRLSDLPENLMAVLSMVWTEVSVFQGVLSATCSRKGS